MRHYLPGPTPPMAGVGRTPSRPQDWPGFLYLRLNRHTTHTKLCPYLTQFDERPPRHGSRGRYPITLKE